LRTYLEEFKLGDVSDEEVETLYKVVNKFALTVRLFWGTWSLVQASISKLDFDFLGYAILIFNEYKKRKAEFLNL
jgi:ethanolamine kinase